MTSSPRLYPVDLSSLLDFTALVKVLSRRTPHSLPILGCLLNSCERGSVLHVPDDDKVYAWTSEALVNIDSTSLFSIIIFMPINQQFRFFCSAESSPDPPTQSEEAHVVDVFHSIRRLASTESPKYNSVLQPSLPDRAPKERSQEEPGMIVIGSLHERWAACLKPFCTSQNPFMKYFLRPPEAPSTDSSHHSISDRWIISPLSDQDIDTARETTHIPRSVEYLRSRAPYSVCVRDKGTPENMRAVAWVLMHADGSIGTLFVHPEYRRQGLAQLVMRELVRRLAVRYDKEEDSPSEVENYGGGALGWNWTDVDVRNSKGRAFFDYLDDWQEGWISHWTYMEISADSLGEQSRAL